MKKSDDTLKSNSLLRTVLLTVAATAMTGCASGKTTTPIGQGYEAFKTGDFSTARNMFESIIAEDISDEKEVYRGIGIGYLGEGDYENAIENFKKALLASNGIVDDMDIDISYYKAVAEYRSGDIDGAISTYDAIIALRPKEDNAYYMRGKAYLGQGNKTKALEDFEQVIALAPNDYDHYLRICEDLSNSGYESDGKSYIQRAMDSSSKFSDYQLGIFNYYLGNYTDARNYLENARNDSKSGTDLILYLGKTYEAIGDADYALNLYESYIADGNPSAGAYMNIGMIKMQQQDYNAALEAFETGISQNDGTYMQSLLYNRIVAYEYLRDFETAKSLMGEYILKYPGDEKATRENIFLSTR